MKRLSSVLVLLLAVISISWAQPADHQHKRANHRPLSPEKLEHLLDLNDEQQTKLQILHEETQTAMRNLRQQEFASEDSRRARAQEILDNHRLQMESILNDEQLAKLQYVQKVKQANDNPKERKPENEERKAAIEAYRVQYIQPVMLEQRAKLEAYISEADKNTIDELRRQRPTPDSRKQKEHPTAEQKVAMRENRVIYKALLESYGDDIRKLLEEIEPQAQKWQSDIQAIAEQYAPESNSPKATNKPKQRFQSDSKKERTNHAKAMHFLLMDPSDESAIEPTSMESTIVADNFPNPAVNRTRITYTLPQEGIVRVELLDEMGNIKQVLFDGQQAAGNQELDVDLSGMGSGVYYYRIIDSRGSQLTQKLIISKS